MATWKFKVKKVLLSNGQEKYIVRYKCGILSLWLWRTESYNSGAPMYFDTLESANEWKDGLAYINQSSPVIVKEMELA